MHTHASSEKPRVRMRGERGGAERNGTEWNGTERNGTRNGRREIPSFPSVCESDRGRKVRKKERKEKEEKKEEKMRNRAC